MKTLTRALFGFAAAFAIASSAQAVPFTITNLSFTPGTGYGSTPLKDGSDDPSLLDATFLAATAPDAFDLAKVGAFKTFTFGSVTLNEFCIDAKISGNDYYCGFKGDETNNLGVSAAFSFTNPYTGTSIVTATGVAVPGLVKDNTANNGNGGEDVDLTIDFSPITVDFGNGGKFSIDLTDLIFTRAQTLTTTATITLLSNSTAPAPVPEPASLALVGLGLLGAGFVRRRKGS